MSIRQDYLNNVKKQLKDMGIFSQVYNQRMPPSKPGYPAATVYLIEDSIDTDDLSYSLQTRTVLFGVQIWVQVSTTFEKIEDDLDRISEQVEDTLVSPAPTVGLKLLDISIGAYDEDYKVHLATLTYEMKYWKKVKVLVENSI